MTGHEPWVLEGGKELFTTAPPDYLLVQFTQHFNKLKGADSTAFLKMIGDYGYRIFDCQAQVRSRVQKVGVSGAGMQEQQQQLKQASQMNIRERWAGKKELEGCSTASILLMLMECTHHSKALINGPWLCCPVVVSLQLEIKQGDDRLARYGDKAKTTLLMVRSSKFPQEELPHFSCSYSLV